MVDFFYAAKASISEENARALLQLASLYEILTLRDLCIEFLQNHITSNNCIELFLMARKNQLFQKENLAPWEELEHKTVEFIRNSLSEILEKNDPFSGLKENEISQVLKIMKSGVCPNSDLLAKAFLKWAQTTWGVRDFSDCLANVDFIKGDEKIQVRVYYNKKVYVLDVTIHTTVVFLMEMIQERLGIPIAQQILVVSDEPITETYTMEQYNIENGTVIQLGKLEKPNLRISKSRFAAINFQLLSSICVDAIVGDFQEQSNTAGFLKLNYWRIKDLIQRDNLLAKDELTILSAIIHWGRFNLMSESEDERVKWLQKLLKYVRFPYIPADALLKLASTFPMLTQCPSFKPLVQEAMLWQLQPKSNKRPAENELESQRAKKRLSYPDTPAIPPDLDVNTY
eukprot:Phypoly_transcript_06954.p1 GENE.Phypoly_transcript_06954~~Phypoly_transcript_06954.p1  ORF type:complete len:399 (+),score=48.61 Phypoly_transcript_06954:457-1653(+)